MDNANIKKTARAYAAEHGVTYTAALRAVSAADRATSPADRYSFKAWISDKAYDPFIGDLAEWVNADPEFPTSRDYATVHAYFTANGDSGISQFHDACEKFRYWLDTQGTAVAALIAHDWWNHGTGPTWFQKLRLDPQFPDTADHDTILAFVKEAAAGIPEHLDRFELFWESWSQNTTTLSGLPGRYTIFPADDAEPGGPYMQTTSLPDAGERGYVLYTSPTDLEWADRHVESGIWSFHETRPEVPPMSAVFDASRIDNPDYGEIVFYIVDAA
ncbi:hypothetical protein [Leifsonia sp. Leaf264]|uniref:hypothetical protein n=1 Tax=Leifsonia sp. Leaf264 TaxID=1736314 RepID=UPI0006F61FCB|nr:hypothetical protein [Leifsonia sp. Leaf264]KQO98518.1 hypothetical protein ASF30_10680 [Leifsonia sp. Leaf264]